MILHSVGVRAALCLYFSAATALASILFMLNSELIDHGKVLINGNGAPVLDSNSKSRIGLYVEKRYFGLFYFIGFVANIIVFFFVRAAMPFVLLAIHLGRRLLESVLVTKFSRNSRMHVFHFISGITYYPAIVLSYNQSMRSNWHAIVPFLLASYAQSKCHVILARLRSGSEKRQYSVPTKFLFSIVSCPHYTLEFVIHALITAALFDKLSLHSVPALLNLVWIVANLSISAHRTKKWYLSMKNTQNMPRFALLPGVL